MVQQQRIDEREKRAIFFSSNNFLGGGELYNERDKDSLRVFLFCQGNDGERNEHTGERFHVTRDDDDGRPYGGLEIFHNVALDG